jgi:SAM-dependent methyltransferase
VPSPDFGYERARRFRRALDAYPRARTTELLPLLAAALPSEGGTGAAVELGSGSGYLTQLLQKLYKTVYAVEKSSPMLAQLPREVHPLPVGGLEDGAHDLPAGVQPELVVSLATFHHIVERDLRDGHVAPAASQARQAKAITAWVDRMAEGGRFLLVDVGRPAPLTDSATYLYDAASRLAEAGLGTVSKDEIARLDKELPYGLRDALDVIGYSDADLDLPRLAQAYARSDFRLSPVGPIDHFDVTVTDRSIEGHDAYWWSEDDLVRCLTRAGLDDVVVVALPTPWLFLDRMGAYWFINELFGLDLDGADSDSTGDTAAVSPTSIIDRHLTIRGVDDHAVVDWQLLYATGVKRGRRRESFTSEGVVP